MSEESIFSEVDEELRRERMRALWRRFAPYVIGAAVAVVLLVAINEGWAWWQKSTAARSSDQFYVAQDLLDAGDIDGAQAALATLEAEGSGEYPVLAKFREASLLAEKGDVAGAGALYDSLATSLGNQRLRELALLLAGYTLVNGGDVDAVNARVSGFLTDGHPLSGSAREALGLAQYVAGDLDGARATFELALNDPATSRDLQGRIQIYVAQLVSEGAAEPTPVVEVVPDESAEATTPAQ